MTDYIKEAQELLAQADGSQYWLDKTKAAAQIAIAQELRKLNAHIEWLSASSNDSYIDATNWRALRVWSQND